MNKGTYIYEGDVQDVFLTASQTLCDAVSHTLGVNGQNTAIPTSNNFLSIINDGKTILESLSSVDPAIKLALNTLKESAFATNKNAGDGTTSTTVLQHHLLGLVLDYNKEILNDGNPSFQVTPKYLREVRDNLLNKELPKLVKKIESSDDLSKVITVSLGSDTLTPLVLEAFDYTKGLKPALVKTNSSDKIELLKVDGVNLAPTEVNPVVLRTMPLALDEPLNVIICTQQLSRIDKPISSLLNKIAQSNKKTVLFYTEIMPSVLDQLLFNIEQGSLNLVPIKLNYPIDKVEEITNELSKYFNCKVLNDLYPYQVNYNKDDIFGSASGYILNKDSVIVKAENTEYSSEILPSKSAAISIGFITFSQQEEDYRRLEDAVYSAYHALTSGYVIGGGFTYTSLVDQEHKDDIQYKPISDALGRIFYIISQNSQGNRTLQEYIDYLSENVYDSYIVVEQVIKNAFTVVAQVLSTEKLLVGIK